MYNDPFIRSIVLITQIVEATVYRYLKMKYKAYRGEVVSGIFYGWLYVLDVPCRWSAPLSSGELFSFKDNQYQRTDL